MSCSEWKKVKLGDLIDSISIKHKFDKDEIIFLNTSDVLEGKVLHNNYSPIDGLPGQAKKSIKKDDKNIYNILKNESFDKYEMLLNIYKYIQKCP